MRALALWTKLERPFGNHRLQTLHIEMFRLIQEQSFKPNLLHLASRIVVRDSFGARKYSKRLSR